MNESVRNLMSASGNNISTVERVLSVCIGMGLAYRGMVDLQENLLHGLGYLATGGVLMARGISGRTVESMISHLEEEIPS